MKILNVSYENFKNIPDGSYELKGKSVLLIADNTFGKTNFMRGLRGVLGAAPGKNLIKSGEDKATVTALLSEFENDTPIDGTIYTFKMSVKKVKGDEKVSLQVTAPDGTRDETKTMVGKIAGEIELGEDFVQLSKTADGKRKQLEIVKSYLDTETIELLQVETNKLKRVYDDRTETGRERDRLHTLIESSGLKFNDFNTHKEMINISAMEETVAKSSEINTKIAGVNERVAERNTRVAIIKSEIEKLQNKLIEIATKNSEAVKFLADTKPVDVTAIQDEIRKANEHNAMVKRVTDAGKWKAEHEVMVSKYGTLTAQHDSSQEAIKDAIRELVHPIPGLSFDMDGQVFYNGKLVSEDTLSFAEQKMVNIALKRAKNPNAKVIFIDNGESIGLEYMRELQAFADAEGYQLIMEEMHRGVDKLTIEMMGRY